MDRRQRDAQKLVRRVVEEEGGKVIEFTYNARSHLVAVVQRADGETRKFPMSTTVNFNRTKNVEMSLRQVMRGINDNSKRSGQ